MPMAVCSATQPAKIAVGHPPRWSGRRAESQWQSIGIGSPRVAGRLIGHEGTGTYSRRRSSRQNSSAVPQYTETLRWLRCRVRYFSVRARTWLSAVAESGGNCTLT